MGSSCEAVSHFPLKSRTSIPVRRFGKQKNHKEFNIPASRASQDLGEPPAENIGKIEEFSIWSRDADMCGCTAAESIRRYMRITTSRAPISGITLRLGKLKRVSTPSVLTQTVTQTAQKTCPEAGSLPPGFSAFAEESCVYSAAIWTLSIVFAASFWAAVVTWAQVSIVKPA